MANSADTLAFAFMVSEQLPVPEQPPDQPAKVFPGAGAADKVTAVRETKAEVLCAADNSCLMHIGGALSRTRAGVRTVHLAEILASTEEEPS